MLLSIAMLAALHLAIIVLILHVNRASASLPEMIHVSGEYTADVTDLMAGSSLMTETATGFVLTPTLGDGSINVGPLLAYANELGGTRLGGHVVKRFRDYDVSEESRALIGAAAEMSDSLMHMQLHAISLVCSVYPLPDLPPLKALPLPALTAEDQALAPEARIAAARSLLLSTEYARTKRLLLQNVNSCIGSIEASSSRTVAETAQRVATLRAMLWVVTLSEVVVLFVNFFILYQQLVSPLNAFVRRFDTDEALNENTGLHEVRLLAAAYNRLLKRRDGLEDILRSAASTDALTGLLNRYGFEQYLLGVEQTGGPLGLVLFDINFLKQTNDTYGHTAGDRLIRSSAECIRECFGMDDGKNCFRFGGDEFAAVTKDCDPETLRQMTERFGEAQKQHEVSISWGCAYTDDISATTVKELMDEADRQMYENKQAFHRKQRESE